MRTSTERVAIAEAARVLWATATWVELMRQFDPEVYDDEDTRALNRLIRLAAFAAMLGLVVER